MDSSVDLACELLRSKGHCCDACHLREIWGDIVSWENTVGSGYAYRPHSGGKNMESPGKVPVDGSVFGDSSVGT